MCCFPLGCCVLACSRANVWIVVPAGLQVVACAVDMPLQSSLGLWAVAWLVTTLPRWRLVQLADAGGYVVWDVAVWLAVAIDAAACIVVIVALRRVMLLRHQELVVRGVSAKFASVVPGWKLVPTTEEYLVFVGADVGPVLLHVHVFRIALFGIFVGAGDQVAVRIHGHRVRSKGTLCQVIVANGNLFAQFFALCVLDDVYFA